MNDVSPGYEHLAGAPSRSGSFRRSRQVPLLCALRAVVHYGLFPPFHRRDPRPPRAYAGLLQFHPGSLHILVVSCSAPRCCNDRDGGPYDFIRRVTAFCLIATSNRHPQSVRFQLFRRALSVTGGARSCGATKESPRFLKNAGGPILPSFGFASPAASMSAD